MYENEEDLSQETQKPVTKSVNYKISETVIEDFKVRLARDHITGKDAIQGLMAAWGNREIDIPDY